MRNYITAYGSTHRRNYSVRAAPFPAQSCPALCDPMDCSPPGSSVHGISQVRILEWDAISSSREPFLPRDQTQVWSLLHRQVNSLPLSHLGSLIKR